MMMLKVCLSLGMCVGLFFFFGSNGIQARPKVLDNTRKTGAVQISALDENIFRGQNLEKHTIARILWFQKYEAKQKRTIRILITSLYEKSAARKYFEATLAWQAGRPQKSLKLVEQSLFLDNTLSFSWALHSVLMGELKQFSSAIASMDRAINLNPYEANYFLTQASHYFQAGKIAKALTYCTLALEVRENFGEAYLMKARLLVGKKKYRLAKKNYRLAREFGISAQLIRSEWKKNKKE